MKRGKNMKIIDLTQGFYQGLKPYDANWYPKFKIEYMMRPEQDPNHTNRTFTQHHIFPHNATHIESSLHFDPEGMTLDQIPLDTFIGRAIVANLSHKGKCEPITADDLERSVGLEIKEGDILLIRTDYLDENWGDEEYWVNPPYLTLEAAQWMIAKQIKFVGFDCLTEKPGDKESPVHREILKAGIPIMEYIRNLRELSHKEVFLIALPVLVEGVESAATRVIAIEGAVS